MKRPQGRGQPKCPRCGGRIISSVINFGDLLPLRELERSFEESQRCDVFFAIGSSLVVTPAADMSLRALESGAKLILVNRGETPFDEVAHLRISAGIGDVVPAVVERVRQRIAA